MSDQFWVNPLPKWDRSNKELSIHALGSKQGLEDANFAGLRALVRVDYNVPIKNGVVTDTNRIDATMDTVRSILTSPNGLPKAVVLICHMGRPGGVFKKEDFSLSPVLDVLKKKEYLGDVATDVRFLPECVGPEVEKAIDECKEGTVFLLENLRFHIEETGSSVDAKGQKVKADPEAVTRFRDALSRLGDIFVFEAFGAAHRPHSSVVGVNLPQRVAGKLMKKELDYFSRCLGNPRRPFLAIIGGAKVSDKIKVIFNMLELVDEMIIGGGMAYTFKKVIEGVEIGSSIFDEEGKDEVIRIVEHAKAKNVKLHLPIDHVVADKFAADANTKVVTDEEGVPEGWMALDVGPKTVSLNSDVISRAQTIIWNGPLGVFEMEAFATGTRTAMEDLVAATKKGCTTIVGGGDTGAATFKFSVDGTLVADLVSHVSTGGGSTLVLMEGTMLPGVDALSDIKDRPPATIDVRQLWLDLHAVKKENEVLREKVKELEMKISK